MARTTKSKPGHFRRAVEARSKQEKDHLLNMINAETENLGSPDTKMHTETVNQDPDPEQDQDQRQLNNTIAILRKRLTELSEADAIEIAADLQERRQTRQTRKRIRKSKKMKRTLASSYEGRNDIAVRDLNEEKQRNARHEMGQDLNESPAIEPHCDVSCLSFHNHQDTTEKYGQVEMTHFTLLMRPAIELEQDEQLTQDLVSRMLQQNLEDSMKETCTPEESSSWHGLEADMFSSSSCWED